MSEFLTNNPFIAEHEALERAGKLPGTVPWNPRAIYEVRPHPTGMFGLWVTYANDNYSHWAREFDDR